MRVAGMSVRWLALVVVVAVVAAGCGSVDVGSDQAGAASPDVVPSSTTVPPTTVFPTTVPPTSVPPTTTSTPAPPTTVPVEPAPVAPLPSGGSEPPVPVPLWRGTQVDGVPLHMLTLTDTVITPDLRARYLGDADQALYLIRPDQHVVARWAEASADEVAAAVRLALGKGQA